MSNKTLINVYFSVKVQFLNICPKVKSYAKTCFFFQDQLLKKQEKIKDASVYNKKKLINDQGPARAPDHVLYVKNAYARLGE